MRNLRSSWLCAISLLVAVSSFAQDRSLWRTAADIREGSRGSIVGTVAASSDARNELQLDPDDDRSSRVVVVADSLTTQFNGFGGVINGSPEIFTGSAGFANVRAGDRVEVRGMGRGVGTVMAEYITLLGRNVAASQTGVGQTRSPSAGGASTPTARTTATSARVGTVEGTIQQVNAAEGRLVIVTDRREVLNVRTSTSTPVNYRNESYRVENLDIGDRVRVEPDTTGTGGDLVARSIEVVRSVQESASTPRANMLRGRVTRVDRTVDMVWVDEGKGPVRVDVATATDASGRRIRASDFQANDRVEVTGRYGGSTNDLFIATTIRFADQPAAATTPASRDTTATRDVDVFGTAPGPNELGAVTIYGTVRETLSTSPQIVLRDSAGRTIRLNVLEDFAVRSKTGTYVTAEKLRAGDSLVVKAYRDAEGNYIAQTIKIR